MNFCLAKILAEVALLRIQCAIDRMLRRGKIYTVVRKWRNWHTRRSQKPVPQGLRVQIPPSAPVIINTAEGFSRDTLFNSNLKIFKGVLRDPAMYSIWSGVGGKISSSAPFCFTLQPVIAGGASQELASYRWQFPICDQPYFILSYGVFDAGLGESKQLGFGADMPFIAVNDFGA